jgi:hypothetical protein
MAKESIKARERKRERLVAKFATKRAALKEAQDWKGLDALPKKTLHLLDCTIDVSLLVALRVT